MSTLKRVQKMVIFLGALLAGACFILASLIVSGWVYYKVVNWAGTKLGFINDPAGQLIDSEERALIDRCIITPLPTNKGTRLIVIQLKSIFEHQGVRQAVFMSINSKDLMLMSVPFHRLLESVRSKPSTVFDCDKVPPIYGQGI